MILNVPSLSIGRVYLLWRLFCRALILPHPMANLSQHSYLPGRWHWRKVSPKCVLRVLLREYKMHLLGLIRINSKKNLISPVNKNHYVDEVILESKTQKENFLQAGSGSLCVVKIILGEKMLGLEPPEEPDKALPCHMHKREILCPNRKWKEIYQRVCYHRRVPKVWQGFFQGGRGE